VLFIVVISTGIFTFVQESKSAALMEGFKQLISEYTNVIRDGQRNFILAENIVPGDLVELRAGNKV
jgi:sodium/potassium-transporting ATPase subunit alpha